VLGDRRSSGNLLLGRPLADTLRWHQGADGLQWQPSEAR
jgi:hypothetical protein